MHDFFFHGTWRMDWGFGNPNKTAALIATLMVAIWIVTSLGRTGFWLALTAFTGLGIALVHTFSRGGIVSICFGVIPIIYFAERPWKRIRVAAITVSIILIAAYAIFLNAEERYEQGLMESDKSITNRIEVWTATPQMINDAANGWGLGKSGKAYMEWYQPTDKSEQYRTLVNSHLTWLVELGWLGRFLYILFWLSMLFICFPNQTNRSFSIALGTWITLATAATFSSVAESPWLWLLPFIFLTTTLIQRYKRRSWPSLRLWAIPFGLTCIILISLCLLCRKDSEVHGSDSIVTLGKGKPNIWIIVDTNVIGKNYGHTLRRYLMSHESSDCSVGIVESAASLPQAPGQTVVLSGRVTRTTNLLNVLKSAKQIIILNPAFYPLEIGITPEYANKILLVYGEYSHLPIAATWTGYAKEKELTGVGDFLPDWPSIVLP